MTWSFVISLMTLWVLGMLIGSEMNGWIHLLLVMVVATILCDLFKVEHWR